MKTPICDFVDKYAREGKLRLHMPGHKGIPFLGVEGRDITEVDGADVLYMSDGIIAESQDIASGLFGTKKTLFSTEGSSLCIRAMVWLAVTCARAQGKKPLILAARNAHKAFMSAAALSGAEVEWICPDAGSLMSCPIDPIKLSQMLDRAEEKPIALYLTSPDYLGNVADISSISKVCHERNIVLMVDNAHGAYLRFLPEDRHPITLGADICCDSAHKTLPVLTGGAYLHISANAPGMLCDGAESAMSLFASTSPSYLILQSLDMANAYMCDGYREKLSALSERMDGLKKRLASHGYVLAGDEKTKLTVVAREYGYSGDEISGYLRANGMECEFSDPDFTVMMLTPEISETDICRLENALLSLPRKEKTGGSAPCVNGAIRMMSIRDAMMSPSELILAKDAEGRILASPSVSCPPAVPIIACGEVIDAQALKCFEYYGIKECRVVK